MTVSLSTNTFAICEEVIDKVIRKSFESWKIDLIERIKAIEATEVMEVMENYQD